MSSKQTGKAPAPPVSVDDDDLDDLDGKLVNFCLRSGLETNHAFIPQMS